MMHHFQAVLDPCRVCRDMDRDAAEHVFLLDRAFGRGRKLESIPQGWKSHLHESSIVCTRECTQTPSPQQPSEMVV